MHKGNQLPTKAAPAGPIGQYIIITYFQTVAALLVRLPSFQHRQNEPMSGTANTAD